MLNHESCFIGLAFGMLSTQWLFRFELFRLQQQFDILIFSKSVLITFFQEFFFFLKEPLYHEKQHKYRIKNSPYPDPLQVFCK